MKKQGVTLMHSGKQHSYFVARALHQLGMLDKYYTSSYIRSKTLQNLVDTLHSDFWSRRFLKGLDGTVVSSDWSYEIKEIMSRFLNKDSKVIQNNIISRDINFDAAISNKIPLLDSDIVWGFQGSCLKSLEAANASGKISICEITMAYSDSINELLKEEMEINPEWKDSITIYQYPPEFEKRLRKEIDVAQKIIAPSTYLKSVLYQMGVSGGKISVVPLGFDVNNIVFYTDHAPLSKRKLKILYAGKITQRKGIKYLLDAVKKLGTADFELTVIGDIQGSGEAFFKYKDLFTYIPGVSQNQLYKLYTKFDVIVLPSLSEGFGLVSLEAMGAGLPVITTANSNGPELIEHGVNGYLVPIRSAQSIAESLTSIRNMQDSEYLKMRNTSREKSLEFTWDVYKNKVGNFLTSFNA